MRDVTARLLVLALASLVAGAHAQGRPRYCHCLFQGIRHTAEKVVCVPNQDNEYQDSCRSEMVPYITYDYNMYYKEPQRMINVYPLYANLTTAREVCRQEGGRLARPQNSDMFNFIADLLKQDIDETAFIDYTDTIKKGVWTASDGSPAPSLPWSPGHPDRKRGESCLVLSKKGRVDDVSCTQRSPFVCERQLVKRVPKGYEYHYRSRTFYKLYKKEKPFHLAKQTCERDGGKLATPDDITQVFSWGRMMPKYTTVWIDFNDEAEEGNFVTSEGRRMSEMEFEVWRQGEPDNGAPYGPPENCVVYNSLGYYMDEPCEYTKQFLCQLIPY